MRILDLPELSLVALVGVSGSGKSTFARRHFRPPEVLSSDYFRGLVSNDENDQEATRDAFETLYYVMSKRLARGLLTVSDATNVRPEDRKKLIEQARQHHVLAAAIVLDTPERVCQERNRSRADRDFGPHVVRRQSADLRRGLANLEKEGFRYVHVVRDNEQVEIRRTKAWTDKKDQAGPFDIVGDVHGCADELRSLLTRLGWKRHEMEAPEEPWGAETWRHPEGRRAIFLGDLADRGPAVLDAIRVARNMISEGNAFCVRGNHDDKFARWLRGKQVQVKHGLECSIAEVEPLTPSERGKLAAFLDGLISHYVFDGGRLVTAHAGLREPLHGRASAGVREFCMYGETSGETDEFGLPVRHDWAAEYRGKAMVVYGHTPVPEPEWVNNTANIDTGAVFGGKLTALRYPEREFVSVPAGREYATPLRPIGWPAGKNRTSQQELDDVLDLQDVTGRRMIETRLLRAVTIREENSIAALEAMSRFAADPHWLIYLPPTMSPPETSAHANYLERPEEAFAYFAKNGVDRVVCQEKHMGSRAVAIVCRHADAARLRFGAEDGRLGICYTRTGRPFFHDAEDEAALIARVRDAASRAGFWSEFDSDWFCFDCELLPWSAKARELLVTQYAAVGAAGEASLQASLAALESNPLTAEMAAVYRSRLDSVRRYREAYRLYCWPVRAIEDYRLAPFHLMASEGAVHADKTNRWHMETLHRLAAADPGFLIATRFLEVDTGDPQSAAGACQWWEELTAKGGEGMVVKPLDFVSMGAKGLIQPAIKCRGREYLRIVYGPEYTAPDQLPKLRARSTAAKRSLAVREFALGLEALHRFAAREPLRRVHECVFAVLALESEPVDPRL